MNQFDIIFISVIGVCLIGLSIFLAVELRKERRKYELERMRLRCRSCGAILAQPEICHDLYLDGKSIDFGKCPRCRAIGGFDIYESKAK